MYLQKYIQEIINAINTNNANAFNRIKIGLTVYLGNKTKRDDALKDAEVLSRLQQQLCEWPKFQYLDQDEPRSIVEYLSDQQNDINNSLDVRKAIRGILNDMITFCQKVEIEQENERLKRKSTKENNNQRSIFPSVTTGHNTLHSPIELENVVADYSPSFLMSLLDYIEENPGKVILGLLLTGVLVAGITFIAIGSCGIGLGILSAATTAVLGAGLAGGSLLSFFGLFTHNSLCNSDNRWLDNAYQMYDERYGFAIMPGLM
jgi:hypothetical protein